MFEFHILIFLYNFSYSKAFITNYERLYLLKQPKATCVLFSIACKINLGLVKNNGNPGGGGGGSLALEIWVGGGGGHSDLGNPGGRWGQKTLLSIGGCGFFLE